MSKKEPWVAADVKCPFWITSTKNSITCEGILPDFKDTISFYRMEQMKKHMGTYCAGQWQRCPLAKEIEKKYRDREQTRRKT